MIKVYAFKTYLDARNNCIIVMLFDTGIRCYELCCIRVDDIKTNAILIHGKGDKERIVPIGLMLNKTMLKYSQKYVALILADIHMYKCN